MFDLAKPGSQAWTAGARVSWDDTARQINVPAVSRFPVGTAIKAAGNGVATVRVRLDGVSTAAFVLDALEQALHGRRPTDSLIHYSDRGSQYVSIRYTERLAEAGIDPSVGSVGDS